MTIQIKNIYKPPPDPPEFIKISENHSQTLNFRKKRSASKNSTECIYCSKNLEQNAVDSIMLIIEFKSRNKFAVHPRPIEYVLVSLVKTFFLAQNCIASLLHMTSPGSQIDHKNTSMLR